MENQEHKIEENPHVFKPKFSKEEAVELMGWFEARMERLPKTLRLNSSTTSDDLPKTVRALMAVIRQREDSLDVVFSSYVSHLILIRMRLTEQGME